MCGEVTPGECKGVDEAMLWAERDGDRCGDRCVVGDRCGLGGSVRCVDSRPVLKSAPVVVGERPMGVGRGTSSVDMLSNVTRGTERERCRKGGGVCRSGASMSSYDGRFCSCLWKATMSSSQDARSLRDCEMLGVEPEELIWSCTDLDLFLCKLEKRKLLFWKMEGELEGVVPFDELLMELCDSAARRRAGSSCWSVTLTSVVLMAARVSRRRLPPEPGCESALPGVDTFLWWSLSCASSLLARDGMADARRRSSCEAGDRGGSSGQASAKSSVRLTLRLLRSVEASVSEEEVRDRARHTSDECEVQDERDVHDFHLVRWCMEVRRR